MALIYREKGIGLWNAIRAAGHELRSLDGIFSSDDDAAVQAIIDAYDPLPDYKVDAVARVKATALAKMQVLFPALTDIDTVNLVAELWLSIAAAARLPTLNMQAVIAIYGAAKNGIVAVNGAASAVAVDAAVAAINWPV